MEQAVAVAIGHGWEPPAALYIIATVARSTLSLVRTEVEAEAYLRDLSAEASEAVTRAEETMRTLPLPVTVPPAHRSVRDVSSRWRSSRPCTHGRGCRRRPRPRGW